MFQYFDARNYILVIQNKLVRLETYFKMSLN